MTERTQAGKNCEKSEPTRGEARSAGAERGNTVCPMKASGRNPGSEVVAEARRLFDALVNVECCYGLFVHEVNAARVLWDTSGPPRPRDWQGLLPGERERRAKWATDEQDRLRAAGDPFADVGHDLNSRWTEAMGAISETYLEIYAAIVGAVTAAIEAEDLIVKKFRCPDAAWFFDLRTDLGMLSGLIHPFMLGEDGLGLIRAGPPTLPTTFGRTLQAITRRRIALLVLRRSGSHSTSDTDTLASHGAVPALPEHVRSAWQFSQQAIAADPDLADATDRQVFDWLVQNAPEFLYEAHQYETFRAYLSRARGALNIGKYQKRRARDGRSIVRPDGSESVG